MSEPSQKAMIETKSGETSHTNDQNTTSTTLEEQKKTSLTAKNAALASKEAELRHQHAEILATLKTRDPKALVDRHIALLHEYNEIRDGGQKLMALIAEERGLTAKEVYEEFRVGESD